MKKLFFVLIICALMTLPQLVQAAGTTVGTLITNDATVSGANFTTAADQNVQTTELIAGARLQAAANSDVTGAIATAMYTNVMTLENLGNGPMNFRIGVNQATNADAGGLWTYSVYQGAMVAIADLSGVTGNQLSANNINLAVAGSTPITIVAQADALLGGGYNEFSVYAVTPDAVENTAAYAGDNGTWYGANWGKFVASQVAMSNTGTGDGSLDRVWRITGSGAVIISITKTIASISDMTGATVDAIIPGATIQYNLFVTNSSLSPGTSVVVADTYDAVNCDYDSMAIGAGTEATWNMGINETTGIATWTNTGAGFEGGNFINLTLSVIIK